ncbi:MULTISPECIES: phosphatidate cytidylyltransferase [Sediminibacterium]|uniref:phosphatidate cytidylyltransferase n=1 Tax=Sediminibacterium TaxID=504481 RepID=UPI0004789AC7|nr:phosphatidate cytidylyltransferase [Sediminibacterium salmoneum]
MALNLQTLKTRALTAVVFVLVMCGGLFYNQWSFLGLFGVIMVGCLVELHRLQGKINATYAGAPMIYKFQNIIGSFWVMLVIAGKGKLYQALPLWYWASVVVYVLIIVVLITIFFYRTRLGYPVSLYSAFGLLYITIPCAMMIDLYDHSIQFFEGPHWVLPMIIIASIWINDTMAYLVGSIIGKTPLSPISPKKTKEGTYGGAVLAVIAVTLAGHYIWGLPLKTLVAVSLTSAIAGTLGDLLESKIKRTAGVKDSGSFMPGHGGFLDRFDSLLIAIPAVWLVLFLFF